MTSMKKNCFYKFNDVSANKNQLTCLPGPKGPGNSGTGKLIGMKTNYLYKHFGLM